MSSACPRMAHALPHQCEKGVGVLGAILKPLPFSTLPHIDRNGERHALHQGPKATPGLEAPWDAGFGSKDNTTIEFGSDVPGSLAWDPMPSTPPTPPAQGRNPWGEAGEDTSSQGPPATPLPSSEMAEVA
jgi:hypothetical protein